jgi:hypothetical protein
MARGGGKKKKKEKKKLWDLNEYELKFINAVKAKADAAAASKSKFEIIHQPSRCTDGVPFVESYYPKTVFIWRPDVNFPGMELTCGECKSHNVKYKGWASNPGVRYVTDLFSGELFADEICLIALNCLTLFSR